MLCTKILNQWIYIFWKVPLCHWVSGFRYSEGSQCLHLQGQAGQVQTTVSSFNYVTLEMQALRFFKISASTHPVKTVSHPRRPASSATLLWELHNLLLQQCLTLLWLCSPSPSQQSETMMTWHLKFQCCCRSNRNMDISVWPYGSATVSQYCLLHMDSVAPLEGLSGPVCTQT